MTWRPRAGGAVWIGPLPDLTPEDEAAYRFCAVPVDERPHPASCARPGTGRKVHAKNGEPPCRLCRTAEALYANERRAARMDAAS